MLKKEGRDRSKLTFNTLVMEQLSREQVIEKVKRNVNLNGGCESE
jgi:hypothetical protein